MKQRHFWWVILVAIGLTFALPKAVNAESLPARPTTNFYDQTDLLDTKTKTLVSDKNLQYAATTQKPQVVMAVVKSTNGDEIDSYAPDLFQKWGIGQKGKDNGVLILYALNDGQRNVRIEVGYGLESVLTDATAGKILQKNASLLKSNSDTKVNEGLQNTFNAVTTIIDKHYKFKTDKNAISDQEYRELTQKNQGGNLFSKIMTIIIIIIILIAIFGGSGGGGNGPRGGRRFPWWLWFLGSSGGYGNYRGSGGSGWGGSDGGGFGGWSGGGGSSGGGGASI